MPAPGRGRRRAKELSIHEAADRLGVHYMTVYRYIRTGRIPARKADGEWRLTLADVDRFRPLRAPRRVGGSHRGTSRRLEQRLLAGDEPGAWAVVEAALAGGATPSDVQLRLLAPALHSIGHRWELGQLDVGEEHRASAVARRLIGRMGPQFARRGRKRGRLVVGAPPAEAHDIPVAMVADHLRSAGFEVVDLGGSTPVPSFVLAARREVPLAVLVGVTASGQESDVKAVVDAVRRSTSVPVLVGGAGVGESAARALGADGWTGRDATSAVAAVEEFLATDEVQPPPKG
jgi:excisionase family DNA binding protein